MLFCFTLLCLSNYKALNHPCQPRGLQLFLSDIVHSSLVLTKNLWPLVFLPPLLLRYANIEDWKNKKLHKKILFVATFSSCLEVFADGSRGLSWFTSIAHSLKHIVGYNHKVHKKTQNSKVVYFMLRTTCVIVKIKAVKIQRRVKLSMTTFIVKLRSYFLSVGLKQSLYIM